MSTSERSISFSADMVRAILDGRKTVTRRPVKGMPEKPEPGCSPRNQQVHPAPYFDSYCGARKTPTNPRGMTENWCWWQIDDRQCLPAIKCPYGFPGQRLWVREAWRHEPGGPILDAAGGTMDYVEDAIFYAADQKRQTGEWRPSTHMPRWASRITLEVVSIRCEPLWYLTEEDAMAEGAPPILVPPDGGSQPHKEGFIQLWDGIYGPGSWDGNPLVWRVEFRRAE